MGECQLDDKSMKIDPKFRTPPSGGFSGGASDKNTDDYLKELAIDIALQLVGRPPVVPQVWET